MEKTKEYCNRCKKDVKVEKKLFNTHICSECSVILASNISADKAFN